MPNYQLRDAADADREFLYELHVAALKQYIVATWGWDETWQLRYFQRHFRPDERKIIVVEGTDVGTISVEEREGELHLGLIELLPDHQGQGIGTALIKGMVKSAHEQGLAATLEVLRVNKRARSLYERLGFVVTSQDKYKFGMSNPPRP